SKKRPAEAGAVTEKNKESIRPRPELEFTSGTTSINNTDLADTGNALRLDFIEEDDTEILSEVQGAAVHSKFADDEIDDVLDFFQEQIAEFQAEGDTVNEDDFVAPVEEVLERPRISAGVKQPVINKQFTTKYVPEDIGFR